MLLLNGFSVFNWPFITINSDPLGGDLSSDENCLVGILMDAVKALINKGWSATLFDCSAYNIPNMWYYLYTPPKAKDNPKKKYPMIVYFDGYGRGGTGKWVSLADPEEFKGWTDGDFQKQFDEGACYVLVPQCPENDAGYYKGWMTFQYYRDKDGKPGRTIWADAINNLIDTVVAKNNINSSRVSLSGLSAGGFMTVRTAVDRPTHYAAVCPSGAANIYNANDCKSLLNNNVWDWHSRADNVANFARMYEQLDDTYDLSTTTTMYQVLQKLGSTKARGSYPDKTLQVDGKTPVTSEHTAYPFLHNVTYTDGTYYDKNYKSFAEWLNTCNTSK